MVLANMAVKSQTVQIVDPNGGFYNATNITVYNGKLYYYGNDDNHINGLISSDGISSTVTLIKETSSILGYFFVVNNLLIFSDGTQLWKSDGTTEGTSVIKVIRFSSNPQLVVMNNKLYFGGDTTNSNPAKDQLWETDGTANGTKLVKTINPSGLAGIGKMFVIEGKIYFSAFDGTGSYNVPWISDGTEAGTRKIKDIVSKDGVNASYFTQYNGKIYFTAYEDKGGVQIWVTDGTTDGTVRITDFNSTKTGFGYGSFPFTLFNSKLFFSTLDKRMYKQLWSTDGTNSGTIIIKADSTSRNGAVGFCASDLVVYNNKLYMSGFDSIAGNQLWASDGTKEGTKRVTNIKGFYPQKLYVFQNSLIMTGRDTLTNVETLYVSDGTQSGTICPKQLYNNQAFIHWQAWVPFNNSLYYRASYRYWQWYDLCRLNLETPSEIPELSHQNLSVYPNPSAGSFNVVLSQSTGKADIEVYNNTGATIYEQATTSSVNIIDLSNQTPGIYILKVASNNRVIATQKIIKK